MSGQLRNKGFSLTEVLMAAGILAIGFAFIAGMFPVGVKLTALATEQTIAPIVVDEAIAKIKLYGVDPNILSYDSYRLFNRNVLPNDVLSLLYATLTSDEVDELLEEESLYPSADTPLEPKRYNWSALCRRLGQRDVYVIVFVSRKAGGGAKYVYYDQSNTLQADGDRPVPVKVQVEKFVQAGKFVPKRLKITNSGEAGYINRGCTIIDDLDGSVYRVLKRVLKGADDVIVLDREWRNWVVPSGDFVWVVPPAEGSGRNPCVRVDPTHTIRF